VAANDRFETLLSRLYEAALEPTLWPAVWAEATAAAGGSAPSLLVVAENGGSAPLVTPGWGGHSLTAPALAVEGEASTSYSRPDRVASSPVSAVERAEMARLTQHLRRAVRLRARLAIAEAIQAASSAALQAADTGVILVTAGGRTVYADLAAQRLAESVGLQLEPRRGALQALDPSATQHLHGLVHDAAAGGVGGDMLMRAVDGSAVALAVCSLVGGASGAGDPEEAPEQGVVQAAGHGSGQISGQALVTLRRLAQVPASARRVAALFGLTRAEADVAVAVAAGQRVAAVAAGRGVSASTVQAQVRSALGKAGVPGVQELGLLFARLG
jgi:DNA-binding CsgD family transcriptional regulator/PAS domain-containing protein